MTFKCPACGVPLQLVTDRPAQIKVGTATGRAFANARRKEAMRDWKHGMVPREIARVHGVSYSIVYKWIRDYQATVVRKAPK